jgi:hypothetical protein
LLFTVNRNVGRLVEARVFQLGSIQDVDRYRRAFVPHLRGTRLLLMADHRAARVYSPEVAEGLVSLFLGLNEVWDRAALLVAPANATLSIQIRRIVRESKSDSRRVFLDEAACEAFLGQPLDAPEKTRLRAFLGESVPVAR